MDISQGLSIGLLMFSLLMGLVSFASPCILPLIPSYVSYITGISFDELVDQESRRKHLKTTLLHSIAFVLGFTLVFDLLGATATLAGQALMQYLGIIRVVGGALLILLGLFVADVITIPFLEQEAKVHLKSRPAGFLGTVFVGFIFGAGWTPCTTPFLGAVLYQAAEAATVWRGVVLLTFYSLGLGIPFILSAVAISAFLSTFSKLKRYLRAIKLASGAILVLMGIGLITNTLTLLTSYLMRAWDGLKGLW